MTITTIIHCDKCDSTDVIHEVVEKPVEEHKTMTEIINDSRTLKAIPAVYVYTNYRMVCKSCGHIVTYSR